MTYIFLLLTMFSEQHRQLVIAERYESALTVSKLCNQSSTHMYYQAVACWKTKDYVKANRYIKDALFLGNLSERHQVVLERMQEEIKVLADDNNKMLDISTDMDVIERRLRLGLGGSKTQDIQKEVIRKLDKEIKEMEDAIQKANAMNKGDSRPSVPQGESKIIEGPKPGEGEIANKNMVQTNEVWGKMPEKEKVKALEAINRQLPLHIREAAEGFSKALEKGRVKP